LGILDWHNSNILTIWTDQAHLFSSYGFINPVMCRADIFSPMYY